MVPEPAFGLKTSEGAEKGVLRAPPSPPTQGLKEDTRGPSSPWAVAHQALLSMKFSRQEYWNGVPFPPSGNLDNPGVKPAFPALAGSFFITSTTWEAIDTWMKTSKNNLLWVPVRLAELRESLEGWMDFFLKSS